MTADARGDKPQTCPRIFTSVDAERADRLSQVMSVPCKCSTERFVLVDPQQVSRRTNAFKEQRWLHFARRSTVCDFSVHRARSLGRIFDMFDLDDSGRIGKAELLLLGQKRQVIYSTSVACEIFLL